MKRTLSCAALFALALSAEAFAAPASPSVCDRTPQVRDDLVATLSKACDQIDDSDLLRVTAIRLPRAGLTSVRTGDFAGLCRLEVLNLKRNAITDLPAGIFVDLASLRLLVILGNNIRQLPDDFTVGNPNLEKIHMFGNAFTSIPPQALQNLQLLPKLNVLDVGKELTQGTQQLLGATFPREDEKVTVIFD